MPRSVRGLGDARTVKRGDILKQESYIFNGGESSSRALPEEDSSSDATSLIRTCEAWATEAFRLPADFLHSLAQPGKKKRSVRVEAETAEAVGQTHKPRPTPNVGDGLVVLDVRWDVYILGRLWFVS